jgi:hypothetical protein
MDNSYWDVWRDRRGKAKGIAIVFVASDIGLELHSALAVEGDREQLCRDLCKKLNKAEKRGEYRTAPTGSAGEGER